MLENETNPISENPFADVPALGDTNGLNTFLQNEQMRANGIDPSIAEGQPQGGTQPATTPAGDGTQPAVTQPAVQPLGGTQPAGKTYTEAEVKNIVQALLAARNNPTGQAGGTQPQGGVQPRQPVTGAQGGQVQPVVYSQAEKAFINQALLQGYSLDAIHKTIMTRRAGGADPATIARIANLEEQVYRQNYAKAQEEFVSRAEPFQKKFGLTDNDMEVFAERALSKGINIAMPNVDLEAVFNVVFPEQYAIRSRRISTPNTPQIIGGNSFQETPRQTNSRVEDAFVEQFLKNAMPGNYTPPQK